jgi:hypothetical protein
MSDLGNAVTTIRSARRGKGSKRAIGAPEAALRAEQARLAGIVAIASVSGLAGAQIRPCDLAIIATIRDEGRVIASKTVRKLSRVEKLERAGVLEKHEAAACQWYSDAHSMAFDTTVKTANWEGVGGGSPTTSFDLLGKYAEQVRAREDYAFARKGIPHGYLAYFENIICDGGTVTETASVLFRVNTKGEPIGERQRARLMTKVVKFCANIVHMRVGDLLPGDKS